MSRRLRRMRKSRCRVNQRLRSKPKAPSPQGRRLIEIVETHGRMKPADRVGDMAGSSTAARYFGSTRHRAGRDSAPISCSSFCGGIQLKENRKEVSVISRRSILLTFAVATLSSGSSLVLAGSRRIDPIRMFDTDNDGTLDLAEVKKAASAMFAKLDRDLANPDRDGTLDAKELDTSAGRALLRLLR